MSKPLENIILSWQQAVLIVSIILTIAKAYNSINVLEREVEYLEGRLDRKTGRNEELMNLLEERVNRLEGCDNG